MKAADRFYCRLLAASLLGVASMAVSAANGLAQDRSTPPITVYPHRAGMSLANADSLIARARERNHLRVIVGTREEMLDEDALEPRQAEAQRARLRSNQQGLLADLGAWRQQNGSVSGQGAPAVTLFETIPFLAMNADAATLQTLLDDPRVDSVQEDVPVRPALPQSVPLIEADRAAALGFSGAGQVVAVLDSGVAKHHPMLAGKVVSEACYSTTMPGQSKSLCPGGAASSTAAGWGVNCPTSVGGCDHGTHVASIAVGDAANLKGVARGAKLIAVKVFSRIDSPADCSPFPAPCIQAFSSTSPRDWSTSMRCARNSTSRRPT
jgi:subtilisin family serine protease